MFQIGNSIHFNNLLDDNLQKLRTATMIRL